MSYVSQSYLISIEVFLIWIYLRARGSELQTETSFIRAWQCRRRLFPIGLDIMTVPYEVCYKFLIWFVLFCLTSVFGRNKTLSHPFRLDMPVVLYNKPIQWQATRVALAYERSFRPYFILNSSPHYPSLTLSFSLSHTITHSLPYCHTLSLTQPNTLTHYHTLSFTLSYSLSLAKCY